jgi:hypothetical protein
MSVGSKIICYTFFSKIFFFSSKKKKKRCEDFSLKNIIYYTLYTHYTFSILILWFCECIVKCIVNDPTLFLLKKKNINILYRLFIWTNILRIF